MTDLRFRGKDPLDTAAKVGESYLDAVLRIQSRLLLFGVTSDIVIPISEQVEVFNILNAKSSKTVKFDVSDSVYGHDAFILDEDYFVPRIRSFLLAEAGKHSRLDDVD